MQIARSIAITMIWINSLRLFIFSCVLSYLYGKIIYFLISIVYLDGMANSAFHSSLVNLKANKPISLNANAKNMLLFIFGYLINNNICMKLLRMKFLLKY